MSSQGRTDPEKRWMPSEDAARAREENGAAIPMSGRRHSRSCTHRGACQLGIGFAGGSRSYRGRVPLPSMAFQGFNPQAAGLDNAKLFLAPASAYREAGKLGSQELWMGGSGLAVYFYSYHHKTISAGTPQTFIPVSVSRMRPQAMAYADT